MIESVKEKLAIFSFSSPSCWLFLLTAELNCGPNPMVEVWNGDDCSMQLLTFPESVPGMATKGLLSAAESGGGGFSKLMLVAITLNK